MNGLVLTFHLAGINNQNFIMRDEQTGTYWQQISGQAISGRLAGQQLKLVPSDELTFTLWKAEQPNGTVLKDIPADESEYSPKDWEEQTGKYPTVLSFPEHGFAQRDLMLGMQSFGEARAFPLALVLKEKLIQDRLGSEPVILLVGPDRQSVRAFRAAIPGSALNADLEFFRTPEGFMIDNSTGSRWNFKGCAVEGKAQGTCLERIEAIKDYWFDWRNYHPATTIYNGAGQRKSSKTGK